MRYKTHIVSSLTLGAGISIAFNYPFHIGYVMGLTFGSLLPDIDEPNSYIGRRSFGIASYVKRKYGHRGITHSLFAWILLTLFCLLYPSPLTIGISCGYLFHLMGDFFSVQSIPVLAPYSYKRLKFRFAYKTGSLTEDILLYFFTFLLFYLVFATGHLHSYLIQSFAELIVKFLHFFLNVMRLLINS